MTHHRILIVDDEPQIRNNLRILLSKKLNLEVIEASNGEDGLSLLKSHRPSLVLLDYNMPGMNGKEVLASIRAHDPLIQIIFLTARTEEQVLIEMLQLGADDFIRKPYSQGELIARIKTHLRLHQLNRDLQIAVHTDDLTGLRNMRGVYREIDDLISILATKDESLCLAMLDMDHFKSVNDGHDHLFGSYVLSECGKLMKEHLDEMACELAYACRFGGDEFLWVIRGLSLNSVQKIGEAFRQKIEDHLFEHNNDKIYLTTSMGMAFSQKIQNMNSQSLLRVADWALYQSKENGRNRLTIYTDNQDISLFEKAQKLGEVKRFTL